MAIEASQIYARHEELFDDEMMAFLKVRPMAQDLATLKMTASPERSRPDQQPLRGRSFVMAGAGMCNAGRHPSITSNTISGIRRPMSSSRA